MRARQFIIESKQEKNFTAMFRDFLPLAMEVLGVDRLPVMKFSPELHIGRQPSFGMYVNGENTLYVAIKNRHPVDILRTVAHELAHYRQDKLGQLNDQSGETGSPEENEAHALAGIIMRHFNKRYPEHLNDQPLL